METVVIKVDLAYVGICILRRLKQELTWAMNGLGLLFKTVNYTNKELKNNANLSQNNIDVLLIVTTE